MFYKLSSRIAKLLLKKLDQKMYVMSRELPVKNGKVSKIKTKLNMGFVFAFPGTLADFSIFKFLVGTPLGPAKNFLAFSTL